MSDNASRGPRIQDPAVCPSLEFKDLCDVIHFEDRGEAGAVYGLELTETGLYQRKEIDSNEKPRFPKFEQIRDVNVDNLFDNVHYMLRYNNKKWTLYPVLDIDWKIKFRFIHPFTLIKKEDKTFRKILNFGRTIVSLVPDIKSRGKIGLKPYKSTNLISKRAELSGEQDIRVQFEPSIKVSKTFTAIFDVLLIPDSRSVSTMVMTGINFSWRNLDEETRVFVTIRRGEGADSQIVVDVSDDKLKLDIDSSKFTHLDKILITHLHLIGFYYINYSISDAEKLIFIESF